MNEEDRKYFREYYHKNKEHILQYRKKYLEKNRQRINAAQRKNYAKHPNKYKKNRKYQLKQCYSITPDDYKHLLKLQNYECAICHRNQNEFKTKLCVDHNHRTGKVRGLLCQRCNGCLGWFEAHKEFVLDYLD